MPAGELPLQAAAPIPAPVPQVVYLPESFRPHRRRRSNDDGSYSPEYRTKRARKSSPLSEPTSLQSFPTVEDWLASVRTNHGAEKRDFTAMGAKFEAQDYLPMDISDLAALPHDAFGKDGFNFTLAEVSFLRKWLDIRMEELRPSKLSRGGGKGKY